MQPFTVHTGIAAPLNRANVDTDAIVPKQFLRKTERSGFGRHLFHEWRYTDYDGTQENPDFILNQPRYRHATILLARDNFGCGSSREHAPWALTDYGFRALIAPSFADIFYNNCTKNGIVPAPLPAAAVEALFAYAQTAAEPLISVDLRTQTITAGTQQFTFPIAPFAKECLLKGLDHIDWTLQFKALIDDYERRIMREYPWLCPAVGSATIIAEMP